MLKIILILYLIFSLAKVNTTTKLESDLSDGWTTYKDEKYIKLLNLTESNLINYDDALKLCLKLGATIIMIKSKEEQDFILKYLLNKKDFESENIWIGVRRLNGTIIWEDNTHLNYTNFAKLRNDTKLNCFEIITTEDNKGKWINVSCKKKNYVLCQREQNWSLNRLKKELLENMREVQSTIFNLNKTLLNERKEFQKTKELLLKKIENSEEKIKKSEQEIKNSKEKIVKLEKNITILQANPVPIGFIYVQLPNQPEPKTLWKMVEWKDVTSEYAGLFFRAEGGNSAVFGALQNENAPRILSVESKMNYSMVHSFQSKYLSIGQWSGYFYTGDNTKIKNTELNGEIGLRFQVSNGEVRPRNKAIRLWKRIK